MTQRIFGARPSSHQPTLVGAGASIPQAVSGGVDLLQWCTGTMDQIGQQCVGEALANAHWIAVRNTGRRASHRGIYVDARVRERMRRGDTIPDVGSDPADAIDSLVSIGVYPLDARDDDAGALNAMEDWGEAAARKLFSIEHLLPIDTGDSYTIDQVLAAGFPVVNWMPVDKAFEELTGEAPWEGVVGQALGGHCTVIVDKVAGSNDYEIWNSWGDSWGFRGFGIVRRHVIEQNAGLCAVLGGPIL